MFRETGVVAWSCSRDLDRVLAGGKRWRLCGELSCIECGRIALVIEVGAVISVLKQPLHDHDAIVVTLHGIPADALPDQVGTAVPIVDRAFERLHERYWRLDVWWTIEQSAQGVVNIHALTIGKTPKRDTLREAFREARDLGLKPIISYEPVKHPTRIACYAAKVGLFSLTARDSRDAQATLNYVLDSGAGRFAHHTKWFFGDPGIPWTDKQIHTRGRYRARAVVSWAMSYDKFGDKLPPRLLERLHHPPPQPFEPPESSRSLPGRSADNVESAFLLKGLSL